MPSAQLDMDKNTPVTDIMTANPQTVLPNDTMLVVQALFHEHPFHHLPVADAEGRWVGILSFSDYLRVIRKIFDHPGEAALNDQYLAAILVKEVMTDLRHAIALDTRATLADALRLFKANRFHALPVIDTHHKIKGVLTAHDLLKVLDNLLHVSL